MPDAVATESSTLRMSGVHSNAASESPTQVGRSRKANTIHKKTRSRPHAPVSPANQHSDDGIEIVRQRRREYMAQYRIKQRDKVIAYENAVRLLREDIERLTIQHQSIAAGVQTKSTPWNVVVEYFRVFSHGYNPPALMTNLSGAAETYLSHRADVLENFLRSTMAPDVVYADICGIDAVVDSMRFATQCSRDMNFVLLRLEMEEGGSLLATYITKYTNTESTMRTAFPHLTGRSWDLIADKVLGPMEADGMMRFEWDDTNGCMTSVVIQTDLVTPYLRRLNGNLEDLALLFDSSPITPDGKIVSVC
ncbi:hypothetical protein PHYBOEH_000459 [Phytophthora boehmeriae]|uniref:Bzip transcription factor n=1 Tax=Phytophthora boehmeriae TaxID=109152 RepID=A0A8T1VA85_9STRA|nr:hypothetical protein PHYBOEH_000459 [Phytophthora boehmeriae]